MIGEILKLKPLVIGVFIVLALYIISDLFSGISIVLPAFLIAGIAVGFMVNKSIKNGAINGVIFGLVSGLIVNVIMLIMVCLQGFGAYVTGMAITFVIYIIVEIVIAAVGGVLGSLIKAESVKNMG